MPKFFRLIRPASLLFTLTINLPGAEHEGLAAFEKLTSKWHQVSKSPVLNQRVEVAFAPDDSAAYFEKETPEGRVLVPVDPENGKFGKPVKPDFKWKRFDLDGEGALILEKGKEWQRLEGSEWRNTTTPAKVKDKPRQKGDHKGWKSADGKQTVEVKEGSLFLQGAKGQKRLLIEAEEGQVFRDAPVWSPDGSRFAIWRTHDVKEREVQLVESSPKDQVQPKRSTYRYPKPGDEIDTRAAWVCFVDEREPIAPDRSLIEHPFSCQKLSWRDDSRRVTFEFIERGFGKYRVIEINSESLIQRVLVNEESDTFIYVYGNTFRHDLKGGDEIIWMSERDGWRHLYLLDGKDGSVKRQLTQGEWVVREVVEVDEENRAVLLKVGGFHSGQDPYLIHYVSVGLDDGKMVVLTESNGNHDELKRSAGGKYYTCRWSRIDHPPVTELRRWADGSLVKVLADPDMGELVKRWRLPEPFATKGRDGKFDIHGLVILPPDFDPAKKYPVVEAIYAGPHGAFVPKSWRPWMGSMHEVAVHGFIVVKIDGRGTNYRSREFHQFAYKNLKDAGLPDREAWIRAAAKKYPQMDVERVGIYGGSAGGQNAMAALLFHGDFYKAAAADCGCHDNRMDKIWWNEQWMDWPVGAEYAANSNVVHADKLQGALFLSVGELDSNVDPSSTYQVVNALIKAGKDFEFLMMPGKGHGAGESRYGQMRRVNFFRKHLGGPE